MNYIKSFSDFLAVLAILVLYQTSINANNHKLDTIYWQSYNSNKLAYVSDECEVYNYDTNGYITTSWLAYWNVSDNSWINTDKVKYLYSDNLITDKIFSVYSNTTSSWNDTLKYSYGYDNNGNLTNFTVYEKTDNYDVWLPSSKEENLFDAEGNLVRSIFSTKYFLAGTWNLVSKDSMVYNSRGEIVEYIGLSYDELLDEWVNYDKELYGYSDDEKTSSYSYFSWNEVDNIWDYYYTDTTTYIDDQTMWFFSYYWNETSGKWVELTKEKHEFDTRGNVTYFAEYEYNPQQERYLYYDKEEYQYDTNNNLTVFVDYNASTSFTWIESVKEIYSYDLTQDIANVYHPFKDNIIGGVEVYNELTSIEQQIWDNSQWTESEKSSFVYSAVDTSVNAIEYSELHQVYVFPNPTSDIIYIEPKTTTSVYYNLFNIGGKMVLKGELNSNYISLSQLPQGEYILVLSIDNDVIIRSLIKQ